MFGNSDCHGVLPEDDDLPPMLDFGGDEEAPVSSFAKFTADQFSVAPMIANCFVFSCP